ncbi:hypothetical protein BLNAU_11582 [Blattamonas nauphoetae]|uniref:Uncharacterized protein n=1 Tax=Blattamonas nauphoetae TaxID=2049346 RepID=A0ABQ9XQ32_9EUKA|nr:hypothetical protein BLNAU_11582 [Blattamonas nauphoetae]
MIILISILSEIFGQRYQSYDDGQMHGMERFQSDPYGHARSSFMSGPNCRMSSYSSGWSSQPYVFGTSDPCDETYDIHAPRDIMYRRMFSPQLFAPMSHEFDDLYGSLLFAPPYGRPPYGYPPYGRPPYGYPPYGRPPYGYPPYGGPIYGIPPFGYPRW